MRRPANFTFPVWKEWVWWPELVGYFLLGALTFALGVVALASWVAEQWRSGSRMSVVVAALAAAAVVAALVIGVRRKRAVLALGAVLAWLGFAAYVLALYGVGLPDAWLKPLH